MTDRIQKGGLQIASVLHDLVANDIIPGTGIEADAFWASLEDVLNDLAPKNKALLEKRDNLQAQIDAWHQERASQPHDFEEYKQFLSDIGYLLPEGEDFQIDTNRVDPEIATIAGPQLVVPVMNARYALNAANARWGSLYDALYGTDVIPETDGAEKGKSYNPGRGAKVIQYAGGVLDDIAPLANASHGDVSAYAVESGKLMITLVNGETTELADASQFAGYLQGDTLTAVLLKDNNLHAEIQIDPSHPVGKDHPAGVKDVLMESAITTIQDCEDSIAAVDAEDKTTVYSNRPTLIHT